MDVRNIKRKQIKRIICGGLLILFLLGCGGMFSPSDTATMLLNDRTAQIIGANSLQNGICAGLHLDGSGQVIGMADSGLDQGQLEHLPLDLQSESGKKPRVAYLQSVSGGISSDTSGHGTHMAGMVVGSGAASDGKYRGIAPGASLYFQAIQNERGVLTLPENLRSLFSMAYNAGVRIHIDGWGTPGNHYNERSYQIDAFVSDYPDFLPVFSAGNDGPAAGTLTMEAVSKNALVVGGSQTPRPAIRADASNAALAMPSSSSGPTADGRIKPDLLAPGSAVVSVASSLIEKNFTANPAYTVLGGSSMAAAAAGGSVALLTQFLQQEQDFQPSAALLKALLIQGARKTQNSKTEQYGFGILDLSTTILSLQQQQMQWEEAPVSLQQGEMREYSYWVQDDSRPLTLTLVWTDPVGLPHDSENQLLNNLDLQVITPEGKVIYGNDFFQQGVVDVCNNVEQIVMNTPVTGEYRIRVHAAKIQSGIAQSYALVYGQNIASQTVVKVQGENLRLSNGKTLSVQGKNLICYTQGNPDMSQQIQIGSQVYWTDNVLYVVQENWKENGIQLLQDSQGLLLTSINSRIRNGGYYINADWLENQGGTLLYNGEQRQIAHLPDGAGIEANVNPISQTLYDVKLQGVEVRGEVAQIEDKTLFLQDNDRAYTISDTTAVRYTNTPIQGAAAARPFGYMERASIEEIVAGMKVCLLIDAETAEVYMIEAERPTVVDRLQAVDTVNQTLTLEESGVYRYTETTVMKQDGNTILPEQLQSGQWLGGLLREENDGELLTLQLLDEVFWGRILYFSQASHTLYLANQRNQLLDLQLSEDILIMRGRAEIGADAVSIGAWGRVILNQQTGCVERLDVVSGVQEVTLEVARYDEVQHSLYCTNDARYEVQADTLFIREGVVVSVENVVPGEKVQLTLLPGNNQSDLYLARVEMLENPGQEHLIMNAEAHYLDHKVVVVGTCQGEMVQIYRGDGSLTPLEIMPSGQFVGLLEMQENEKNLLVSSVKPSVGLVDIWKVPIDPFDVSGQMVGFTDIAGSLYKDELIALKNKGIISGYTDGSFQPNEPIIRIAFLGMLVKATGEIQVSLEGISHFQDASSIPWWGFGIVHTIWQRGWTSGLENQKIRPNEYLYAHEASLLLKNCEKGGQVEFPVLRGGYLTREEAAVIVYRLMQLQGTI